MSDKANAEQEILRYMRLAVVADNEHRYNEREDHINQAISIMSSIVDAETGIIETHYGLA